MTEIRKIEKVTYNGRKVKIFEAWKILKGITVYAGGFYAPVQIANKNLLAYIIDNYDYVE